jgi:hypothetical protein
MSNLFEKKIQELEKAIERLKRRRTEGWRYRKTWIKSTTVKAHRRNGYYAMLQVRRSK